MTLPSLSASTARAATVLALVFASGFVSGVLTDDLLSPEYEYISGSASAIAPSPQLRLDASLEDLTEHLGLNPVQMEQIRVILDDVIIEEADLLSELRSHQEEARMRITRYLTPEQSERFHELVNVIVGAP